MFRRKFLKSATGAAAVGLTAGCIGGEDSQATEMANPDETTAAAEATTAVATESEETTAGGNGTTAEGEETTTGEGDVPDIDGQVADDSPENLTVTSRQLYRTDDGEVGLQGTVENTGDETYEYVEAEVTLQDDEGDPLYEFIDESEEEQTVTLDPGATWQFDVVFQEADDMSAVTGYTIALDGATGDMLDGDTIYGEVDEQDPNLEIRSHDLTREESTTYVSGTVENAGGEDIESVEVSVTLYDADDTELDVFSGSVEQEEDVDRLAPGESWDFRVEFDDIDMQTVGRYVIRANSTLV